MVKTTSAERMRKLHEKLNQDKNKYESFKEKEKARDKKRREKMKLQKNLSAKSLMEYRRKETEGKRKYRQKIKESRPIGDTTSPQIGSFKCPQSLGKAVTRVLTEVFKLKVSDVYTEEQDGVASCTNETDVSVVGVKPFVDGVTLGTYVLVEFETTTKRQSTRPTKYRYAAICQSNVEEDEVKVMCMRAVNNSGKLFKVDEKDISYVQFEHILSILPQPNVKQVRSNIFYEFTGNVDVFENG